MTGIERIAAERQRQIDELMGHRRLGGRVSQVEQYGVPMLRIDVPALKQGEVVATQFVSGASIYCLTPTTEEMASAVALRNQPTLNFGAGSSGSSHR